MSSELVDTTEMYLRTFYELLEEGVELRRARIVERLHQSGPTVSQTVARMERDGLVVVESDRSISLTQEGHDVAQTVMRKHRLAECLLTIPDCAPPSQAMVCRRLLPLPHHAALYAPAETGPAQPAAWVSSLS